MHIYDNERLARLLRVLRPAPARWVAKAKQIFVTRPPDWAATPLTDSDVTSLGRALETDSQFRERFDVDPVAATEAAGMPEIARALEYELRELIALAERIATDSAFRAELGADPVATLGAAGVPSAGAEPLVQALALPDEIVAKLPEVVAHEHQELSPEARLLLLLLRSKAAIDRLRAAARST